MKVDIVTWFLSLVVVAIICTGMGYHAGRVDATVDTLKLHEQSQDNLDNARSLLDNVRHRQCYSA